MTAFTRSKLPEIPGNLKAKWPGQTLDEGFTPFPKRLIRCLGQLFVGESAVNELRIILAIVDYARPNVSRPPSLEYLAFTAGLSPEEFKAGLKVMQERQWIKVTGTEEAVSVQIDGLTKEIEKLTAEVEEEIPEFPF